MSNKECYCVGCELNAGLFRNQFNEVACLYGSDKDRPKAVVKRVPEGRCNHRILMAKTILPLILNRETVAA